MLIAVKPIYSQLEFRQMLLSDSETMSYNEQWGGIIDFSASRWDMWYKKWIEEESTDRLYRLLFDGDSDRFVGEIAFYRENDKIQLHVLIYAPYRRCGYGREGLELLCNLALKNGHTRVFDTVAKNNIGAQALLRLKGFRREGAEEKGIVFSKVLKNKKGK